MENKCSFLKTLVDTGINACKKVEAFQKACIKKILSRKESDMIHNVNFAFGKVDPWIKEKSNSAKEISLAELEIM